MTKATRERALTIKQEIGAEKAGQVSEYLSMLSKTKRSPASVLECVKEKFELTTEQAGACWYAWQIYQL